MNPFAPGPAKQPPLLAGRDGVFRALVDQFDDARRGAGYQPQVLFGERGMGKTVLLDRLVRHARQHRWAAVRIEAQHGVPLGVAVAARLPDLYRQLSGRAARMPGWLRELTVSVGAGVARAQLTVGAADAAATPDPTHPLAVDNSLLELAERLPTGRDVGVVVALDEIHQASTADLRAVGRLVQAVNSEGLPLVIASAGLPAIRDHILDEVPTYANRFTFQPIGRLSVEATQAALVVPANRAGVLIQPGALDGLTDLTGGYPYFVQLYGRHVWDIAAGAHITAAHVAAAHGMVMAALDAGPYGAGWERLRPSERRFLTAMAATADDPVDLARIVGDIGQGARTLSPVRQRLLDGGLVEPAGHGKLRFVLPGYGAYVRHRAGTDQPLGLSSGHPPRRRPPRPPSGLGLVL